MITAESIAKTLAGERRPQRTSTGFLTLCPCHADDNFSLHISQAQDGKLLYHDHGGCSKETLTAWFKAQGYLSGNGNRPETVKPRIVATYDYQDPAGKVIFQVVRREPKDFLQRRPDGKGGWIWNMKGVDRVTYRLPQVLKADLVFVVEGEKDADNLAALGLTATTNAGGASKPEQKPKWRSEYNPPFQGKQTIILSDNDPPGKAHALDVAQNLHGVAASVKVIDLPGLPEKGDVSDWLKTGGTKEKLLALVEAAPEWEPQADPSPKTPMQEATAATTTGGYSFSDLGNARRLVAQHGQDLHYCHLSKKWWVWTGKVWAIDNSGEVRRRAKLAIATIYGEAGAADEDQRKKLAAHALRSEHDSRIRGMLSLAESEPGIPISPGQMDANPWVLNCLNGTVDLTTGKLRPHNRADLITRLSPVAFDPTASCKLWEGFLDRIQAGNHDVISFNQRTLGYALTGDCREQCLFVLWGSGANGKSTYLSTVSSILGNYAMQTPTETLLAKQHGEIPNDIARLNGPRFVTALEVSQGRRLAEPLVKQLTGQDTIAARFLFGEYFDFKPQFKLFLGTNHKPVIKDTSHAMWRRIRLIPFPVQIPEDEQDKSLPDVLLAEAPGILAWAVRGCLSWQHGGLSVPDVVREATGEYQAEQDVLGEFLSECCITTPGASALAAELYKAYTAWAEENGEKKPFSQKVFGITLAERGFDRTRGHGGKTVWQGIGVKD